MIEIHVTCKDETQAKDISKGLLEKKLVACANFFPVKTTFSWKGKIESNDEFLLHLKTKKDKKTIVNNEIKKLHSYDVPVIVVLSVKITKESQDWLNECVD